MSQIQNASASAEKNPNNTSTSAIVFDDKAIAIFDQATVIGFGYEYKKLPLVCGVFKDRIKEKEFIAFDNTSGDFWVESFKTREEAVLWCTDKSLDVEEVQSLSELKQIPHAPALLHFIAIKDGEKFHFYAKTEYDARIDATCEIQTCSDFYQVFTSESGVSAGV